MSCSAVSRTGPWWTGHGGRRASCRCTARSTVPAPRPVPWCTPTRPTRRRSPCCTSPSRRSTTPSPICTRPACRSWTTPRTGARSSRASPSQRSPAGSRPHCSRTTERSRSERISARPRACPDPRDAGRDVLARTRHRRAAHPLGGGDRPGRGALPHLRAAAGGAGRMRGRRDRLAAGRQVRADRAAGARCGRRRDRHRGRGLWYLRHGPAYPCRPVVRPRASIRARTRARRAGRGRG